MSRLNRNEHILSIQAKVSQNIIVNAVCHVKYMYNILAIYQTQLTNHGKIRAANQSDLQNHNQVFPASTQENDNNENRTRQNQNISLITAPTHQVNILQNKTCLNI